MTPKFRIVTAIALPRHGGDGPVYSSAGTTSRDGAVPADLHSGVS